jgi:hypothetical protein
MRCPFETNPGVPGFSFGTKWNQIGGDDDCKLLKRWWPGTESNRRRQPFQGCLPTLLSGSKTEQVDIEEWVTRVRV